MICPTCKSPNQPGGRFCTACGSLLIPTCSTRGFANTPERAVLFADLNNGILTLFGALVPHEDHAVRAGLGIQRKLRQAGMADRARVGLNSGEALYRIIASDLGTEVDVVGLMVHVAARVERLAPAGAVYLTGETQALTQRLIETRKAGRPTSRVRRRGRHLWRSRATGLGRTMPCDAFASALRDLFGISERDDEDRVRQRVAAMPGYLDSR